MALIGGYTDDMRRIDDEFSRLQAEQRKIADAFNKEKATIEAMLEMEDRRHNDGAILPAAKEPPLSLKDFIVARIENGGPIDKDSLQRQAVQAGFEENGRAFNMTLQNVATGERVKKLPDGRFAAREANGLFGMGRPEGVPMTTQ